jgi:hypothetical protein
MIEVRINANEMKMLVNPCTVEFISKICFARCCSYNAFSLGHALIMPLENEIEYFKKFSNSKRAVYDEKLGIIRLESKKCIAQNCNTFLCNLHNTGNKPFGCRIMPLTLKNGYIRIRGFIRSYYCQKHNFINVERVPFYIGFRQSMVAVFGEKETDRIIKEIESGKEEISVNISETNIQKMNDIRKIFAKISKSSKQA